MINFDKETCGNLDAALSREWLETNGLGGYASSTIIGLNTRRYHGLLVAATRPPVGRMVLLSKLEETLIIDGQRFELSTNQYPARYIRRAICFRLALRSTHFRLLRIALKISRSKSRCLWFMARTPQ